MKDETMKRYIQAIEEVPELEPIVSMSRIGLDSKNNMLYYVNPDINRVCEPYFKVYDSISHTKATHIARISFKKPKYIVHRDETGKQPWKLSSSEKKKMIQYLDRSSGFFKLTFFQYAMYCWNNEFGFLDIPYKEGLYHDPIEAYKEGFYDVKKNLEHPSYLPSYHQMPDYLQL